jgi:signal transduction histidine kinase
VFDGSWISVRSAHGLVGPHRGSLRWGRIRPNSAYAQRSRARTASCHDLPEAVAIVAGIVAATVATAFALHWDPHLTDPGLRASIETTIAVAILLAGALTLVDSRRRTQIELLALLGALVAVGLTNLLSWAPRIVTDTVYVQPGAKATLVLSALVPLMFVIAAFAGGRVEVGNPRRTLILVCTGCLGAVAVAEGIDLVTGRTGPVAAGSEATLIVNVAASIVFVLAAAGLFWRSRPATAGNCLLAGSALLLAAARFQAVATSAVPGAWVTPRELLRLGAYGLLLAAAVVDYRWRRRADDRASVAAQREGLVRDLHDGLVQDLAAVAMHSEQLDPLGSADPAVLGAAARRALAVSRLTIIDLSAPTAPNTITSLSRLARELEAEYGTDIAVRVDADPRACPAFDLDHDAHQRFVRVARNTIINAAGRCEGDHVDVVLRSCGNRWRLTVRGDGAGLGPARSRVAGCGALPERRERPDADREGSAAVATEFPLDVPANR